MSILRIALTVATIARSPVVRAALADPRRREAAIEATRGAAYTAGRIARLIVGPPKG